MNPTAILSIFSQAERYIFSLAYPTESMRHRAQRIHAPSSVGGVTVLDSMLRERLNHAINEAVEEQRFAYRESRDSEAKKRRRKRHRAVASLEHLGQFLFNLLLPPALQNELLALPDESPIILTTNDVGVPWELLHDGERFLALKHPLGRRLFRTAPLRRKAKASDSHLYLFISNPSGDLHETDEEIDALIDLFEPQGINDPYPRVLAHTGATKWKVLEALGVGYDIIHYSGHAEPGRLFLADGQLSTNEIEKTLQGQPFVFLNACWSAKGESAKPADEQSVVPLVGLTARSLAEGFIQAGAIGFLGTLWPVFDKGSREFAEWFYTRVRRGMSVGEALRQTRLQMREEHPDDPIWASFVFYGDPMLKVGSRSEREMRHLTALVARIEGVFGLFDRLELEEAADLHEQLINLLKQIGEAHHGQVHLPLNDMLKIHFGVPNAHGDDVEQAMQAALRMIEAVRMFDRPSPPAPLPIIGEGREEAKREDSPLLLLGEGLGVRAGFALRIGISTRRVLVRHQRGMGAAEYQIVGDVEGVANALAAQAEPNQIIVDHNTKQVAHDKFTFQSLDSLTPAAGLPALTLYQVAEKIIHPAITALVGRESELNQLEQQWRKAKRGQGRVVGIEGEPGIGKTRLMQAFHEQLQGQEHLSISTISHTHDQKQSYALLGQVIRQFAQLSLHEDGSSATTLAQQEKMRHLVLTFSARSTEEQINESLALLGHVVGLPVSWPTVDNLEPAQRQKRLVRVVVELFKHQSAYQPILLVLEDLQWADEASLAVFDQVMRQVRRMRLLLVALYRTDWEWPREEGRHRFFQALPLEELDAQAQESLLANLLGAAPSVELSEVILSQTGGNPLFLQEYIRLLQENGGLIRSDKVGVQATDLSKIPLLNKVERVIQARFDKLTLSSRQLMQKASVIGKEFEEDLLSTVQDRIAHQTFEDDIELLSERKLIEILGGHPFCYTFSHGLIHEIAYQLLPAGVRQTIHRQVAEAIESLYGNQADISRLAHHYYHSNDRINAIRYALRAAKQNAEEWANQTALEWYQRAQEGLDRLKQQPLTEKEQAEGATDAEIISWQVEALTGKGEVQSLIGKSDDAIESYTHALQLVTASEAFPVTRWADLYHKIATVYHDKAQYDLAQEAVHKGLQVLQSALYHDAREYEARQTRLGKLHIYTGVILWKRGQFADALVSCQQGIAILEKSQSIRDLAQGYNLQGILYRRLADNQKATISYERSIELYEQAQYIPGLERASYNLAYVYVDLGQWNAALCSFSQCSTFSYQTGEVQRQAAALNAQGEIYLQQGKLEEAITAYQQVRQIVEELGIEEFVGVALMNLGATYLSKEAFTDARVCLEKSVDLFECLQANQHLAECLRYLAQLELSCGQKAKALKLAQEAVDWALKLEHRQQEGQARRALGQAHRTLGQLDKAAAQLEESLAILEERNIPYEKARTLVELALLYQAQADATPNSHAQYKQAIASLEEAMAIFEQLGAALDLKRAQEIKIKAVRATEEQ